jgi:hypothetical protein
MKSKYFLLLLSIITIFSTVIGASSCTEEKRTKRWGGSMTIELEVGRKFVNATWKDDADLWYSTRKMLSNESADTIHFHQHKGGLINLTGNGDVIFIESNSK